MAETQVPTVGYMGEVHLESLGPTPAVGLYKLVCVTGFDIPGPGNREQVETTCLDSPGWRRTYTSTFYEDSEFEVTLQLRALSDTDVLLEDANVQSDVRDMLIVIPENGAPSAQIALTAKCIGYSRGTATADEVIEATATFQVVTIEPIAAYVTP